MEIRLVKLPPQQGTATTAASKTVLSIQDKTAFGNYSPANHLLILRRTTKIHIPRPSSQKHECVRNLRDISSLCYSAFNVPGGRFPDRCAIRCV